MFARCYADGCYRQALGIAFESRRADKVEEAISRCPQKKEFFAHVFTVCQTVVSSRDFRHQILRLLVKVRVVNLLFCSQLIVDSTF
jgi:26S proteasome regulatory subunit N2